MDWRGWTVRTHPSGLVSGLKTHLKKNETLFISSQALSQAQAWSPGPGLGRAEKDEESQRAGANTRKKMLKRVVVARQGPYLFKINQFGSEISKMQA